MLQQPAAKLGWSATIKEQREQIADLLEESPSLRALPAREQTKVYSSAITKAVGDTGLPEAGFPAECPFTPQQILAEGFSAGGLIPDGYGRSVWR